MNVYYPFKKYDYVLNDKNIFLAEKIITLLEVWKKMGEFDFSTIDLHTLLHVFDWLNLHTINITLTAEWQVYVDVFRNELLSVIERVSKVIIPINTNFENRFQKLIHVIINTWTNPVLEKLMKLENIDLNDDDINFFNFEQAHLISIRLIKLCNSNCEDLAINLATAFLRYLKTENLAQYVKISADQIWFIFDLRVALLYKFKEVQQVEEMVNILNYEDGIYFINRFVNKKPHLLKIWKYAPKIAILAIQIFLEKIIKDNSSDYNIFSQLLTIYTTISISTDSLDEYFLKIKRLTEISDCVMLQNFCNFFKKISNPSLKSFIVEIFIKTLTALLNELEHHKDVHDLNKILIVTTRLAEIFCSLAEFMSDKIKVARECVLTAFSLEPTTERLQFMVDLALKSGLQITSSQEWICKLHPPVLQTDDVTWQCPECHEYMTKPQLDIPLKANLALNEAIQTLDLPETLCEDLIVCISNPRYQVLSWYLPWTVLHRLCVMYLKDPQATKNYVTELKFVDIDYSMFEGIKKEPFDEYSGIEKGYEKYLDKNFIPPEEEEIEEENSESCAIEGEDYDPNSIESLKKILSIQNSQEEKVKKLQEGEYSGSRFNRNPRSILKSSFLKANSKNLLKQKNLSKDLRVIKMKSQNVTKDKNKRKVKQII